MKVLLVNGSGHAKGCTYTALEEVAGALEKNGIETEIIQVGVEPIAGCIGCGACFDACEHNARSYYDDTEEFFADLAKGQKISLLIAPAFAANYPNEYRSILGGLKKMGVNRIISVSFGADITTWAYIRYITEHNFTGANPSHQG